MCRHLFRAWAVTHPAGAKIHDTWSSASELSTDRVTASAESSQLSDSPHPTLPGLVIAA